MKISDENKEKIKVLNKKLKELNEELENDYEHERKVRRNINSKRVQINDIFEEIADLSCPE